MLKRFRQYRIERAYKVIASNEQKIDVRTAMDLRTAFANDTIHIIDGMHKRGHIPRHARRQLKRSLVK